MENMEAPLRRAERSLTLFVRNNRAHDCTLELAGVCSHCETYWDMRDEIEYEIMMETTRTGSIMGHAIEEKHGVHLSRGRRTVT